MVYFAVAHTPYRPCESQDKIQAITADFASHVAFAEAVMAELEAIAPVERGWGIDFAGQPHQNAVLLDHGAWLTLIRRFGLLQQFVIEPADRP